MPDRLRLDLQWPELVAGKSLVILDEAQAWPRVFPRLRALLMKIAAAAGDFCCWALSHHR